MKTNREVTSKVRKYYDDLLIPKKKIFLKELIDHYEQSLNYCPDPKDDAMLIKVKEKFVRRNGNMCCASSSKASINVEQEVNSKAIIPVYKGDDYDRGESSSKQLQFDENFISDFINNKPTLYENSDLQCGWGARFTYNSKEETLYSSMNYNSRGLPVGNVPSFMIFIVENLKAHRRTNEFTFYVSNLGVVTCAICQEAVGFVNGKFVLETCKGTPNGWSRKKR